MCADSCCKNYERRGKRKERNIPEERRCPIWKDDEKDEGGGLR